MSTSRHDPFAVLDWDAVLDHYNNRVAVHQEIVKLHRSADAKEFALLALGISDRDGNYSAAQWAVGPKILASNANAAERVHQLAGQLLATSTPLDVPGLIRASGLTFLGISIGSEISCMMKPDVHWIANARTIWTHLLVKHDDNIDTANEALSLYRTDDSGEMSYKIWRAIHGELDTALTRIAKRADNLAHSAGVKPGKLKYLWADAIADSMYAEYRAAG